mgnify:CR=1 FL=1
MNEWWFERHNKKTDSFIFIINTVELLVFNDILTKLKNLIYVPLLSCEMVVKLSWISMKLIHTLIRIEHRRS